MDIVQLTAGGKTCPGFESEHLSWRRESRSFSGIMFDWLVSRINLNVALLSSLLIFNDNEIIFI